jgi:hypothetical protein
MSEKPDRTIDAGPLRFHAQYRSFGNDYGPAVAVFAETKPGAWKEVLRYDCFANEPHRHHFRADGREDRVPFSDGIAGGIAAAKVELADITSILERIGYGDVLHDVSAQAIGDAVGAVERELMEMETEAR